MKTWHLIYWFHTFSCISFVLLYLITPIYNSYKQNTRILPLVDCYPFNIFVTPVYHFMYAYQCGVVTALVMHGVHWDQFLIGLLFFASGECDILCDKLRNLKLGETVELEEHSEKLIECIKHHKKIRR